MKGSHQGEKVIRNELDIFSAALDVPKGPLRTQFVQNACMGDPELAGRVFMLLEHAEERSTEGQWAITQNSSEIVEKALDVLEKAEPDEKAFGNYVLGEQIGEGGTSIVYEAASTALPKKRLAIKILKPGMESMEIFSRFRFEAEALQTLHHPNIAKIVDSGSTPRGRPYLVMERIEGLTITSYCKSNKLKIDSILAIFLDICSAVQHAHQRGIIHRDLKPSNILVEMVDGRPVPKVLDFGLAKATNPVPGHLGETKMGQLLGTIEYMSPEQAALGSKPVDVRSDVYSLTSILYEMIAGISPLQFELHAVDQVLETLRIITERVPRTLSSVVNGNQTLSYPNLRGLDPVFAMGLKKDPDQRYESVRDLARDIQGYLEHRPLRAKPLSFLDQMYLFVRRNRSWVLLSFFVSSSLVFCGVAGWVAVGQYISANNEQTAMSNFMLKNLVKLMPSGDAEGENASSGELLEAMVDNIDQIRNPQFRTGILLRIAEIATSRSETGTSMKAWKKMLEYCELQPNEDLSKKAMFGVAKCYYDDRMEPKAVEILEKMQINEINSAIDLQVLKLEAECDLAFGHLDDCEMKLNIVEKSQFLDTNTLFEIRILRGHILSKRGYFREAVTYFTEIFKNSPRNSEQAASVTVDIGENRCLAGDHEEGLKVLFDAVAAQKLTSGGFSYPLMRAQGILLERYLAVGKYREALELSNEMKATFDQMSEIHAVPKWIHLFSIRRSECYFGLGDNKKVIEILNEPKTPFTEPWDIFERESLLAVAYFRIHDLDNCKIHLEIARKQEQVVSVDINEIDRIKLNKYQRLLSSITLDQAN